MKSIVHYEFWNIALYCQQHDRHCIESVLPWPADYSPALQYNGIICKRKPKQSKIFRMAYSLTYSILGTCVFSFVSIARIFHKYLSRQKERIWKQTFKHDSIENIQASFGVESEICLCDGLLSLKRNKITFLKKKIFK